MGVKSRTLQVTVISAQNVRVTEDDAYVVVRAESLNSCTTKTAKDNGNGFISWNQTFSLDVPMHARSVTFEVQCKRFKGFRPLGVARIALSDFLCGATVPENGLQVFSYRLRDWQGKRNGVIHFAVREAVAPVKEECLKGTVVAARNGCGFDAGDEKKSNEAVVGVPLWWNYPNII